MLVTPDMVWKPAVHVLRRRHTEHLGRLERQLGHPGHIEPVKAIDVLALDGERLKTDVSPCILVTAAGTVTEPRRKAETVELDWMLAMEITVAGRDRMDTVTKLGWYTMTAIECLLQRVPRSQLGTDPITLTEDQLATPSAIQSLTLRDVDLIASRQPEAQRTLAQARVQFDVGTGASISLGDDALPADDTDIPPGTPGGAPEDPYDDAIPWPPVATVTASVDLKEITDP